MKKSLKQTAFTFGALIFSALLSACAPKLRVGNSVMPSGSCGGAMGCESAKQTEELAGEIDISHLLQDRTILATKCYINGQLVLSALGNIAFPMSSWAVVRDSPADSYHGYLDLLTTESLTMQSANSSGKLSGIPLGKIHVEFKGLFSGEILLKGEANCVEVPITPSNGNP